MSPSYQSSEAFQSHLEEPEYKELRTGQIMFLTIATLFPQYKFNMHLRRITSIVRLQDSLKSLSVVVSTQTQFFVDVPSFQKQFRIFLVYSHWFIQLSMESIKSSILQDTHLTWDTRGIGVWLFVDLQICCFTQKRHNERSCEWCVMLLGNSPLTARFPFSDTSKWLVAGMSRTSSWTDPVMKCTKRFG